MQGFDWFTSSLEVDADGDAAHGFITEQHTAGPGSSIGNGTHTAQGSSSSSSSSLRDATGSSEHSQVGHGAWHCYSCSWESLYWPAAPKQRAMSATQIWCVACLSPQLCLSQELCAPQPLLRHGMLLRGVHGTSTATATASAAPGPYMQLATACHAQSVLLLLLLLLLPPVLLVLQATAPAVPQKQQQFKVHGVRQGHLVVSHT